MVEASIDGDASPIDVQGRHRLWALDSTLHVPLDGVVEVRQHAERATRVMPGLRFPGTHVPYVNTAGTSCQADFRPDFWTVRHPEQAIVIQCSANAAFDEIIVEVADPADVAARRRAALEANRR